MEPSEIQFTYNGSHRLIPSRYRDAKASLGDLAENAEMLEDILLLDAATNDRVQGEHLGLIGISPYELVYGIANAHIVNGAFTYTNEGGSRFNDETRGAWYAADELETSLAEVAYHKARRLAEIVVPGLPGERPDEETATYDDWLADFRAPFYVLEPPDSFAEYLQPEPVPECYAASQALARTLLKKQGNGLIYPSVRRPGARCFVCFRPALVYNLRRAGDYSLHFKGVAAGYENLLTASV